MKKAFKVIEKEFLDHLTRTNKCQKKGKSVYCLMDQLCVCIELKTSRFNNAFAFYFQPQIGVYFIKGNTKSITKKILEEQGHILVSDELVDFLSLQKHQWVINKGKDPIEISEQLKVLELDPFLSFLNEVNSLDDFLKWLDKRAIEFSRDPYAMNVALALVKNGDLEQSKKYFLRSEGNLELIKQIANNHGVKL